MYGEMAVAEHWFAKYVEPMNRLYCRIHGYEYVVERLDSVREDRHGNWEKVALIQRNLHDCGYLFFLDADACFYCHLLAIHEEIIPLLPDERHILVPVDVGGEHFRWNTDKSGTGVMLFRNTPVAHTILEEWDAFSDTEEGLHTRWQWSVEQAAFGWFIYPKHHAHIQVCTDYYRLQGLHGYFVRHLFNCSGLDREAEFKRIFESELMRKNRRLLKR